MRHACEFVWKIVISAHRGRFYRILQAIWATALLIPGNFDSLVQFFGFASWAGYGASGVV